MRSFRPRMPSHDSATHVGYGPVRGVSPMCVDGGEGCGGDVAG